MQWPARPYPLPLAVACFIGLSDSVVALLTSFVVRPDAVSIVVGVVWIAVWGVALWRVRTLDPLLRRRPWLLAASAPLALLPAVFDGGYPGNLATQPVWLVVVAACVGRWPLTLATGASLFACKATVFAATDSGPPPLGHASATEARTAVLLPLVLVPLSIAFVGALRQVIDAVRPQSPPALALSPAESAIVGLLADGLTPKEIATARGTSLATVRTQIKNAKRSAGARTLDELVASWRLA